MSGYRIAWIVGAGLVVATIGIALTVLRPAPAADEVAEDEIAEIGEAESAYSEAA